MLLLIYPSSFSCPRVLIFVWSIFIWKLVLLSFYSFLSVPLVVLKYHFPKALESGIESLAHIGLGKLPYELHQVGVLGDHKSGDGDVQFSGLLGHGITFFHDIFVKSHTVLIIVPIGKPQTGGLSIGDHKN